MQRVRLVCVVVTIPTVGEIMSASFAHSRQKFTRRFFDKKPHTSELHRDDPGLHGRDHVTRLDESFNRRYLNLCAQERARYIQQCVANSN